MPRLPGYSHLFLVVGVGSRNGTTTVRYGANVPSIDPAPDLVEGSLSPHHNRQRPEKAGRAKSRITEAQATRSDRWAAARGSMEKNVEKWRELCELAAKEPDPKRLMQLTDEIVRLLDEKRQPLNAAHPLP